MIAVRREGKIIFKSLTRGDYKQKASWVVGKMNDSSSEQIDMYAGWMQVK